MNKQWIWVNINKYISIITISINGPRLKSEEREIVEEEDCKTVRFFGLYEWLNQIQLEWWIKKWYSLLFEFITRLTRICAQKWSGVAFHVSFHNFIPKSVYLLMSELIQEESHFHTWKTFRWGSWKIMVKWHHMLLLMQWMMNFQGSCISKWSFSRVIPVQIHSNVLGVKLVRQVFFFRLKYELILLSVVHTKEGFFALAIICAYNL